GRADLHVPRRLRRRKAPGRLRADRPAAAVAAFPRLLPGPRADPGDRRGGDGVGGAGIAKGAPMKGAAMTGRAPRRPSLGLVLWAAAYLVLLTVLSTALVY